MTWYFNFCAPTIPNDSTISFHRGFQTGELIVMFLIFAVLHTYYKLCGPNPLSTQSSDQSQNNEIQSKKQSDQSASEKEEQISQNDDDDKQVSIAQKIKDQNSENESYVSFKTSKDKFNKKKNNSKGQKTTAKSTKTIQKKQCVTLAQIQSYFPIVFGHHAVAIGASIMYSPYAEQSIAAVLYVIVTFFLIIVNSQRMRKTTFAVWIFMAFLNVFIMMSALLQVGQSNYDYVNNVCFAEEYIPLY